MRITDETGAEISEEQADLTRGYLLQVDGEVKYFVYSEQEYKRSRLAELHRLLAETDYCVIKIAEGAAAADEYADTIARRQAWRREINELEVVE